MNTFNLLVVALLLGITAHVASAEVVYGSVSMYKNQLRFSDKLDTASLAFGSFNNSLTDAGFSTLVIESNHLPNRNTGVFKAVGFLEGVLTKKTILTSYNLFQKGLCDDFGTSTCTDLPPAVISFMKKNIKWSRTMIKGQGKFLQGASQWFQQFDGMLEALPTLKDYQLFSLMAAGDFDDLTTVLNKKLVKDIDFYQTNTHCSSSVRLTATDLFVSHVTWDSFSNLPFHIAKRYRVGGSWYSVSASPAHFHSVDDFWRLSSNIVVMETSFNIFNHDIYERVTPESFLNFIRLYSAVTMFPNDAEAIANAIIMYNSGTYNNQYMIIDYNKAVDQNNKLTLLTGAVWISEYIPGFTNVQDVTSLVVNDITSASIAKPGFWPSFNVPYDKTLYRLAGYEAYVHTLPKWMETYWTYYNSSRYNQFMNYMPGVQNYDDYIKLMRRNDFRMPYSYSNGDPAQSLSSRYDLRPSTCKYGHAHDFGAHDIKVVNRAMVMSNDNYGFDYQVSPTRNIGNPGGVLPAFKFNSSNLPFDGCPAEWDFPMQRLDLHLRI
ncbi:hypothetical protein PCE1_003201 [Barthelona sp. PCE]